jgi:hypothetical protein
VDAIAEPPGDQVKVGLLQAEDEERRGGDVGDRVGDRDLVRHRRTRGLGAHLLGRDDRHGLQSLRWVEAGRREATAVATADHEPAVDRGGDVVGVAFDLGRSRQQLTGLERELVEVVCGGETGDDRGGARAEPPRNRNLAADAEADAVGGMQGLEGAYDEVVPPGRDVDPLRLDRELTRLGDLELELHGDRGRHDVIARTEIGRARRDPNQAPPLGHRPATPPFSRAI